MRRGATSCNESHHTEGRCPLGRAESDAVDAANAPRCDGGSVATSRVGFVLVLKRETNPRQCQIEGLSRFRESSRLNLFRKLLIPFIAILSSSPSLSTNYFSHLAISLRTAAPCSREFARRFTAAAGSRFPPRCSAWSCASSCGRGRSCWSSSPTPAARNLRPTV